MNEIDLLPEWYKNKKDLDALIKKTVISMAVIFMLSAVSYALLVYAAVTREAELLALEAEIDDGRYELSDRIYHELLEAEAEIGAAERAFGSDNNADDLAARFKKIYDLTPGEIGVAEISYHGETRKIVFSGVTERTEAIPEFIRLLGEDYSNASLVRLHAAEDGKSAFTAEFFIGGADAQTEYY